MGKIFVTNCDTCDAPLDAEFDGNHLRVVPCDVCITACLNEGIAEGTLRANERSHKQARCPKCDAVICVESECEFRVATGPAEQWEHAAIQSPISAPDVVVMLEEHEGEGWQLAGVMSDPPLMVFKRRAGVDRTELANMREYYDKEVRRHAETSRALMVARARVELLGGQFADDGDS